MASFTESDVLVDRLTVYFEDNVVVRAQANGHSVTSSGVKVRSVGADIFSELSESVKTNLSTKIITKAKASLGI